MVFWNLVLGSKPCAYYVAIIVQVHLAHGVAHIIAMLREYCSSKSKVRGLELVKTTILGNKEGPLLRSLRLL